MDIVGLLVFVLVCGLVFWAINQLASSFGIPAPIVTVLHVLLVIVVVLGLLQILGLWSGGPSIRLR